MEAGKYLNEETYQKNKKKITRTSLVILMVGILIGGSIIAKGLMKNNESNSKYSDNNKAKIQEQISIEKQNLIKTKTELENKIKPTEDEIKKLERTSYTGRDDSYYARQDRIKELQNSIATEKESIDIIKGAFNETCYLDKLKNNTYTSKYCSLKNELKDLTDFNKNFDSYDSIPFYMIGVFIIVLSGILSGSIYFVAKGREITAFSVQQVMPIAQESVEAMTPTAKKAVEAMAPTIGKAAGIVAKSIKDSLKDDEK